MATKLADDLIDGVDGIAAEMYGEATPSNVRRVRYLLATHGLPHVQRGRMIWSFRPWLAAYLRGEPIERTGQ